MDTQTVKKILKEDLPVLMSSNKEVRQVVLQLSKEQYSAMNGKVESRFDLLLAELKRDREEQSKKWDEHNRQLAEQNKKSDEKWEEQKRQWAEFTKKSDEKWEEQNKKSDEKWEEQKRQWAEFSKKSDENWEAQNKKSDENWEAQNKKSDEKWEEQNKKSDEKWEEQKRQWAEFTKKSDEKWAEQDKKWAEQDKKWDALDKKWDEKWAAQDIKWLENRQELNEMKQAIVRLGERYDSTMGAVGARWGSRSEASFRNAISDILEKFNIKVSHIDETDIEGVVFGRPASIELDIVIANGELMIGELKSSLSKGDISIFFRKAAYYQNKYNRKATHLFVISPMINRKAMELAAELKIKVYNHSDQMGEALAAEKVNTD